MIHHLHRLALRAFSGDITFYKNAGETAVNFIQPGLQSLRLDGRAVTGTGGDVNVQIGGRIILVNGGTATGTSAVQGMTGTLNLAAQQIELGGGIQAVTGFQNINLTASERVYVAKSGALEAGVVTVSGSAAPGGKVSVNQQRDLVFASGASNTTLRPDRRTCNCAGCSRVCGHSPSPPASSRDRPATTRPAPRRGDRTVRRATRGVRYAARCCG